MWSEHCYDPGAGGRTIRNLTLRSACTHPADSIDALADECVMEPALSTLSEIAANLMKRERMTEGSGAETAAQDAMGWEQLMTLSKEKDVHKWQAALTELVNNAPGKRRVTVLRVIEGGLS